MEFVCSIDGKCKGSVLFQEKSNHTLITVNLKNLKKNSKHGIHIHRSGDLRNGCNSLCQHYNPYNVSHGGPNDNRNHRHVGDLGNVHTNQYGNVVNFQIKDKLIKLRGKHSILGRSVIIHQDEDDLGNGNNAESLITGNAGKRIGCGVIGYSEKCCE
jgi:Cu-Zn family superoxide dismutase